MCWMFVFLRHVQETRPETYERFMCSILFHVYFGTFVLNVFKHDVCKFLAFSSQFLEHTPEPSIHADAWLEHACELPAQNIW